MYQKITCQQNLFYNFNPDDFFSVMSHFQQNYNILDFHQIMGFIRMSHYDPKVFTIALPQILNEIPDLSKCFRMELLKIIPRIWDHYYPIENNDDLAFNIGQLLMKLDCYDYAVNYFKKSVVFYGYRDETIQNLIICYYRLNEYDKAIEFLEKMRKIEEELKTLESTP